MKALVLILCLASTAAGQSVESRLRSIPPLNESQLEAYAREKPALSELMRLWTGNDAELARKAAIVLSFSGKPALAAIVSAKPSLPEQRVWAARTLIYSARRPSASIARYVNALFLDRDLLPGRGLQTEEAPPPQRVCDEAYSAALAWLAGLTEQVMLKRRAFARLDERARDAEIKTFRQSRRWRNLIR